MSYDLMAQFARRFIQRRDIKAVQLAFSDKVIYTPDRELKNPGSHAPLGFMPDHIYSHLMSKSTYGHYLLDSDSMARVFCYDIDLKQNDDNFTGHWIPIEPFAEGMDEKAWESRQQPIPFDPRAAWLDRSHGSRAWTKMQMGMLARKLCATIQKELGIGTAAAYSGNKGIHVYGFTGPLPAAQVRAAAHFVLECTDDWELERGEHIYHTKLQDPFLGYPNFNLEVYPKQDDLGGKDLGNLLRLPLGANLKNPQDPTFFIDLRTPVGVLAPHPNPVELLTTGNPFAD